MKQKTVKPPLFRIASKVWAALDPDTMLDTMYAMQEMDIWSPPYMHFVVESPLLMEGKTWGKVIVNKKEDEERQWMSDKYWRVEFKCNDDEEYIINNGRMFEYDGFICGDPRGDIPFSYLQLRPENAEWIDHWVEVLFDALIILLATKNAEKKTIINDARSRTHREREDSKKYVTTTTIKIGAITETVLSEGGTGRTVRPHLRRGHVRQQRFGEGREQIKKVFIAPCFVNADKDWVDINKDYKVVA